MEYFKPKAKKGIESKGKAISKRAFILNIENLVSWSFNF